MCVYLKKTKKTRKSINLQLSLSILGRFTNHRILFLSEFYTASQLIGNTTRKGNRLPGQLKRVLETVSFRWFLCLTSLVSPLAPLQRPHPSIMATRGTVTHCWQWRRSCCQASFVVSDRPAQRIRLPLPTVTSSQGQSWWRQLRSAETLLNLRDGTSAWVWGGGVIFRNWGHFWSVELRKECQRIVCLQIIDSLSVNNVQKACSPPPNSTSPSSADIFQTAMDVFCNSNARVDGRRLAMRSEYHIDNENFEKGRGIITEGTLQVFLFLHMMYYCT